MRVVLICTTYNRDTCLSRALSFFQRQILPSEHSATLLVFNSGEPTSFPEFTLPDNKSVILLNRVLSNKNGQPYLSVGDKYNDAIELCPTADIVVSADVDDTFLPNYIIDGIRGMQKAYEHNKLAFKPKKSFYKANGKIHLMENVFEPSIFVDYTHIKDCGYYPNSVKYHDKWMIPLIEANKILVDESFPPGFCYDWSGELPVYKMSGRGEDTQQNFNLSQKIQKDKGNGITIPISVQECEAIYQEIYTAFPQYASYYHAEI